MRGCDDFHRTSHAARGAHLTRRQLITRGVGAGLAVYAARAMPMARLLESAGEAAAAAPNAPILVSVFLPGGADLLDTLVPGDQYGQYADKRSAIKLPEGLPALGSTGLRLHPSLGKGTAGGVAGLYARGQVGFLPGIDYADPDLSHFHSRHFWESGLITAQTATGWLGRWLDHHGNRDNPLQGISMSSGLSPLLRSSQAPVAALESPSGSQVWMDGMWGDPLERAMAAWGDMAAANRGPAATAARLMHDVAGRMKPYAHDEDAPNPLAPLTAYPENNELASRLSSLAGLLGEPLGIRVASVEAEGEFDTHDNQREDLDKGLQEVSEALSAFQLDLELRGLADRVLTFVWSEFGRRAEANTSGGTDHGAGGVAWVQGPRARGGVLTDYPDLTKLDDHGNLAVTVDFRRVYCSLLEQWMGTDAGLVMPGAGGFGRVQLVA
jgi:uncharacterized protein (DUF1501 family)